MGRYRGRYQASPLGHLRAKSVYSSPSNIRDLLGPWFAEFSEGKDFSSAGVQSYYTQPERPDANESKILNSGFIDYLLSPYCSDNLQKLYKNFLGLSLPVLSIPYAAPSLMCQRGAKPLDNKDKDIDILYIGNCWPFKK